MSVKDYTIRYNVEGLDQAVGKTKNLIYALNAVRLSLKDIQMVLRGPTIQNMMWTAIQLTRTYTHIRRLMRIIAKEQEAMLAKAVALRVAQAQPGHAIIVPRPSGLAGMAPLLGPAAGFAAAHPVGTAVVGGVVIGGALFAGWYWQQEQAKKAYQAQQRQIAKSQGLTP